MLISKTTSCNILRFHKMRKMSLLRLTASSALVNASVSPPTWLIHFISNDGRRKRQEILNVSSPLAGVRRSRRQNRRKSRRRRCAADTCRINPVIGIVISSSHARGWMGRLNNRTIAGWKARWNTYITRLPPVSRCRCAGWAEPQNVLPRWLSKVQGDWRLKVCGAVTKTLWHFFFFHSDPTVRTWKLFTGKLSTPPPWSRISRGRREKKKNGHFCKNAIAPSFKGLALSAWHPI